jgi:hypothetical protein
MNQKLSEYATGRLPSSDELPLPMDIELQARQEQQHLHVGQSERETLSIKVGHEEVDDDGNVKFSWRRLLAFAGVLP